MMPGYLWQRRRKDRAHAAAQSEGSTASGDTVQSQSAAMFAPPATRGRRESMHGLLQEHAATGAIGPMTEQSTTGAPSERRMRMRFSLDGTVLEERAEDVAEEGNGNVLHTGAIAGAETGHGGYTAIPVASAAAAVTVPAAPSTAVPHHGISWDLARSYGIMGIVVYFVTLFRNVGVSNLPGSVFSVIIAASIVWNLMLSRVILRRRFNLWHYAAGAAGIGAVILVGMSRYMNGGSSGGGPSAGTPKGNWLLGVSSAVAASFCIALMSVLSSRITSKWPHHRQLRITEMTIASTAIAEVLLVPTAWILGEAPKWGPQLTAAWNNPHTRAVLLGVSLVLPIGKIAVRSSKYATISHSSAYLFEFVQACAGIAASVAQFAIFDEPAHWSIVAALGLLLMAFAAYIRAQYMQERAKEREKAALLRAGGAGTADGGGGGEGGDGIALQEPAHPWDQVGPHTIARGGAAKAPSYGAVHQVEEKAQPLLGRHQSLEGAVAAASAITATEQSAAPLPRTRSKRVISAFPPDAALLSHAANATATATATTAAIICDATASIDGPVPADAQQQQDDIAVTAAAVAYDLESVAAAAAALSPSAPWSASVNARVSALLAKGEADAWWRASDDEEEEEETEIEAAVGNGRDGAQPEPQIADVWQPQGETVADVSALPLHDIGNRSTADIPAGVPTSQLSDNTGSRTSSASGAEAVLPWWQTVTATAAAGSGPLLLPLDPDAGCDPLRQQCSPVETAILPVAIPTSPSPAPLVSHHARVPSLQLDRLQRQRYGAGAGASTTTTTTTSAHAAAPPMGTTAAAVSVATSTSRAMHWLSPLSSAARAAASAVAVLAAPSTNPSPAAADKHRRTQRTGRSLTTMVHSHNHDTDGNNDEGDDDDHLEEGGEELEEGGPTARDERDNNRSATLPTRAGSVLLLPSSRPVARAREDGHSRATATAHHAVEEALGGSPLLSERLSGGLSDRRDGVSCDADAAAAAVDIEVSALDIQRSCSIAWQRSTAAGIGTARRQPEEAHEQSEEQQESSIHRHNSVSWIARSTASLVHRGGTFTRRLSGGDAGEAGGSGLFSSRTQRATSTVSLADEPAAEPDTTRRLSSRLTSRVISIRGGGGVDGSAGGVTTTGLSRLTSRVERQRTRRNSVGFWPFSMDDPVAAATARTADPCAAPMTAAGPGAAAGGAVAVTVTEQSLRSARGRRLSAPECYSGNSDSLHKAEVQKTAMSPIAVPAQLDPESAARQLLVLHGSL